MRFVIFLLSIRGTFW